MDEFKLTSVGPFDPTKESWINYTERLENYFVLKNTTEELKTATLINCIGPEPYGILKNIFAPVVPNTRPYKELVKALTDHYVPATMKWAERFQLNQRIQKEGESCIEFGAALRRLAIHCQYGNHLDEALTLIFICGLKSETIRKRLLLSAKDTFKEMLEAACKCENAEKHSSLMSANTTNAAPVFDIRKVENSRNTGTNRRVNNNVGGGRYAKMRKCNRCHKNNHSEDNCFMKNVKCYKCGKVGHIAVACRNSNQSRNFPNQRTTNPARTVNVIETEEMDEVNVANSCLISKSSNVNSCLNPIVESPINVTEKCKNMSCCENMINYGKPSNIFGSREVLAATANNIANVNSILNEKDDNYYIWPIINNRPVRMEIDTGSAVSIMSLNDIKTIFSDRLRIRPTRLLLKTYTGELIKPVGAITLPININDQKRFLKLYIVNNRGHPLFGRQWIRAFSNLNLFSEHAVKSPDAPIFKKENICVNTNELIESPITANPRGIPVKAKQSGITHHIENLITEFHEVFKDELGTLKGVKGKLYLKPNAKPVFCKARSVPFSLREKVTHEIDRLVEKKVLFPVSYSEWATPVVPIVKKDGSIRLCGDYKTTLNKALLCESYPLPKIDEIFAAINDGKHFSVLDLSNAYLQLVMDDFSQQLLTINTHKGLFAVARCMYGVSSAAGLWQKFMEQVLQGLKGVKVILDDMLIFGATVQEHNENLRAVLQRLKDAGLRLNKRKCKFLANEIEYCGHVINAEGLHKSSKKVEAMVKCPPPENVTQVRAFLGLVNYYHKFLPNLSSVLHPIHQLLKNKTTWAWTEECKKAFTKVKEMIVSEKVLTHYNPSLPIKLACDASAYGLGAVLSHSFSDGSERPISFVSRTLTRSEKNYSQIDKEALAIVFGVKKFYNYIYGRHFTLVTDHKPLTHIFNPEKGIPVMSAARLQRFALILAAHQYDIEYKKTDLHANADGMSRLPLKDTGEHGKKEVDYANVYYSEQLNNLPVTPKMICLATRKDPILGRVFAAVQSGSWPNEKELQPFYLKRNELSLCQGCIVWGPRVVIPSKYRQNVLNILHEGHLGVVKMKAVARSNVWWQGIDLDIEKIGNSCEGCIQVRNKPTQSSVHPWAPPSGPWQRLHIDFGTKFDKMFLIVVCAFSKWPEVVIMNKDTTSKSTIRALEGLFSRYGLPMEVVSDNGPQLVSEEIERFFKENGIKHNPIPTYHPQRMDKQRGLWGPLKSC